MKLLDQVRSIIRKKHYSIRTEEAYLNWVKRYILFHNKRHPKDLSENDISRFISHLATDLNVAASTQNQALNAIVFLYKQVLGIEMEDFGQMERAKKPVKLPVVLSKEEARKVLSFMTGDCKLMAQLLYAAVCVSWNACDCGFRILTLSGARLPFATAKA